MPALYRDYRPKTFAEVINQVHIKTTLQNAAAKGTFAHAYLFTGPRGTGKTSMARIFARAINCPDQNKGEPCNKCQVCLGFLEGHALDLIEIDAASNTGVENVRELIETLRFSPVQAKHKVFIIDEVHMLSKGAFNALLKTLEEPPAHAIFILATTEIHKVPATVASRTQRFDFKKIEQAQILGHLVAVAKKENIRLDSQSLSLIANSSEGSMRDALSILDKLSSVGDIDLEQVEQLLGMTNINASQQFLSLLHRRDAKGALDFLEQLFSSGADPVQFNKDFLEYLRKVLMYSTGAQTNFALDDQQLKVLAQQAAEVGQSQLLHIIRLFMRANKDFETSPSLELAVEIAAAEACLGKLAPLAQQTVVNPVNAQQEFSQKLSEGKEIKSQSVEFTRKSINESESYESESTDFEKPKAAKREVRSVSFEELLAGWPGVLDTIRERQSTLLAVMKTMRVKSLEPGNVLNLSCSYKFHRDNLDNLKNKGVLLAVLEERFKTPFEVKVLFEKEAKEAGADSSVVAMEVFGGEII